MSQSKRSDSSSSANDVAPDFNASSSGTGAASMNPSGSGRTGNGQSGLTEQAREGVTQAQDQVDKLVGMARGQATNQLATQKAKAAGTLGSLASALHQASSQLRQQDDTVTAGYIDTAAGQVDRLADLIADQNVDELLEATGQFARRQPALFLAAAFALGFASARFLKSSSANGGRTRYEDQFSLGQASAQPSSGHGMSATRDWQPRTGYAAGMEGQ